MSEERKTNFIGAIVGINMFALFSAATIAHAEIFDGYPDAIICRGSDEQQVVVYIGRLNADGSAIYMSLGDAVGSVTPDFVFHRKGNEDCDGKTVDQLKQEGKTRDFN